MKKFLLVLVLVLSIQTVIFTGCGDVTTAESEFLVGTWIAETATYDDVNHDPEDIFGGTFILSFRSNGKCTMSIDKNSTDLKWKYKDGAVTLKGDSTYEITFPDKSKEKLIIDVKGIDVLMTKYVE